MPAVSQNASYLRHSVALESQGLALRERAMTGLITAPPLEESPADLA